jgi:hypothetical protein
MAETLARVSILLFLVHDRVAQVCSQLACTVHFPEVRLPRHLASICTFPDRAKLCCERISVHGTASQNQPTAHPNAQRPKRLAQFFVIGLWICMQVVESKVDKVAGFWVDFRRPPG